MSLQAAWAEGAAAAGLPRRGRRAEDSRCDRRLRLAGSVGGSGICLIAGLLEGNCRLGARGSRRPHQARKPLAVGSGAESAAVCMPCRAHAARYPFLVLAMLITNLLTSWRCWEGDALLREPLPQAESDSCKAARWLEGDRASRGMASLAEIDGDAGPACSYVEA